MEALKRKAPDAPTADANSPLKAQRADSATPPPASAAPSERVACVHDVSYPEGYDASTSGSRIVAGGGEGVGPAKTFPFPLDPFQSEAIRCLDNGESVMVNDCGSFPC
jgi:ATP-dependent RNA helicase DOB1